jgi:hypothetical protein
MQYVRKSRPFARPPNLENRRVCSCCLLFNPGLYAPVLERGIWWGFISLQTLERVVLELPAHDFAYAKFDKMDDKSCIYEQMPNHSSGAQSCPSSAQSVTQPGVAWLA